MLIAERTIGNDGVFSKFGVADGEILITFTIVGIKAFILGNKFSLVVLLVVVVVDGVDDILVVLVGPGLLAGGFGSETSNLGGSGGDEHKSSNRSHKTAETCLRRCRRARGCPRRGR